MDNDIAWYELYHYWQYNTISIMRQNLSWKEHRCGGKYIEGCRANCNIMWRWTYMTAVVNFCLSVLGQSDHCDITPSSVMSKCPKASISQKFCCFSLSVVYNNRFSRHTLSPGDHSFPICLYIYDISYFLFPNVSCMSTNISYRISLSILIWGVSYFHWVYKINCLF